MIYRDPVIVWRSEYHPERIPQSEPPPGPFTVSRSEVVISKKAAPVVHIWYALVPSVPAGHP